MERRGCKDMEKVDEFVFEQRTKMQTCQQSLQTLVKGKTLCTSQLTLVLHLQF
jgi:hypothetical protein